MDSASPSPAGYVVPNPRTPKVLGILNIVFASGLMICGLCSISYYSFLPILSQSVEKIQKEVEAKEAAQRQRVLEELAEEEKAATTEEAKAEVKARRTRVEAEAEKPKRMPVDLGAKMFEGTGFRTYLWAEFASGFVLNLLLLTAGIGLVMRRLWGLKLGLAVATLKIVRLVLVYGYAATVMAPKLAVSMAKFQLEQMAQQTGGKPLPPNVNVEMLTKVMSIWFAACALGMVIFGSIYPIVSLWLLSRPGARAACSDELQAKGQAESW